MPETEPLSLTLADMFPTTDFKLDARTAADLLRYLEKYCAEVPFNEETNWLNFWFNKPGGASQLYDIYCSGDDWQGQLPVQQTFLLALLKLLETPKTLINSIPARHRELYYRAVLGLTPRSGQPDTIAVSFTLAKNVQDYLLVTGTLLDAGRDSKGNPLRYALDYDLVLTGQQLNTLLWTVNGSTHIVLDKKNHISLPDDGISLFDAFSHTVKQTGPGANQKTALLLGFGNTGPGEVLTLYWELDGINALKFNWFYYNGKTWSALNSVLDETRGFTGRGRWQAVLPDDIKPGAESSEVLAPDSYWIKALPDPSSLVAEKMPQIRAVLANAVTATLVADGIADDHFLQPLAAHTVSQLTSPVPYISQVEQPLPSTGGGGAETEAVFISRAGQRLAHRQRAVTRKDIHALLTERYPQIRDIRLPAIDGMAHIPAPESLPVTILTSHRYSSSGDPLRPKLEKGQLTEMGLWLQQHMSPWVVPQLRNPDYVDVSVNYQVVFNPGIDHPYGFRQLGLLLRRRFMPWADNLQSVVTTGNKIDYYQLLATLQGSPLVKRITSLTLQLTTSKEAAGQQSISAVDSNHVLLLTGINGTAT